MSICWQSEVESAAALLLSPTAGNVERAGEHLRSVAVNFSSVEDLELFRSSLARISHLLESAAVLKLGWARQAGLLDGVYTAATMGGGSDRGATTSAGVPAVPDGPLGQNVAEFVGG